MTSFFLCVLSPGFIALISAQPGRETRPPDVIVEGTVYDQDSNAGIPGLTVRLIPPRSTKKPERVLPTDQKGYFCYKGEDRGTFLLEVYQGVTLLYRKEIDTMQTWNLRIPLKKAKA